MPAHQLSHTYGTQVGTSDTDRLTEGTALACSATEQGRYLRGRGTNACHQRLPAGEALFQSEMNGENLEEIMAFFSTGLTMKDFWCSSK